MVWVGGRLNDTDVKEAKDTERKRATAGDREPGRIREGGKGKREERERRGGTRTTIGR